MQTQTSQHVFNPSPGSQLPLSYLPPTPATPLGAEDSLQRELGLVCSAPTGELFVVVISERLWLSQAILRGAIPRPIVRVFVALDRQTALSAARRYCVVATGTDPPLSQRTRALRGAINQLHAALLQLEQLAHF